MPGFLDALRAFFNPPSGFTSPDSVPYGTVWITEDRGFTSANDADFETRGNSSAGEVVDAESAMGLIAVQAAVRLLVNDIRSLPVDVYRGSGSRRAEISKPAWMLTPNLLNPNYTWTDYVGQIVYSMLTEGESFTRCFPDTRALSGVGVIPATSILDIKADALQVTYHTATGPALTPNEVVHIPWVLPPGKLRGLNPIEAAAEGLGIGLASDRFTGRFFGEGATLSGWIEFPAGAEPTDEQVKGIKADFRRKHQGARRSHAVGALTGGAKYVPFDYNNKDAQLQELRDAIVEDVARLFGIPPHMLGSQKPGAVGYASVEQRSIDYVTHAVLPIVNRIEAGHNRLLRGGETYLKFNVNGLLRGDAQSRATYYGQMAQIKVMRREEIRAFEDLPYDPDSVGYLETPNNNPPDNTPGPDTEPQRSEQAAVEARHLETLAALRQDPPKVDIHVDAPAITLDPD